LLFDHLLKVPKLGGMGGDCGFGGDGFGMFAPGTAGGGMGMDAQLVLEGATKAVLESEPQPLVDFGDLGSSFDDGPQQHQPQHQPARSARDV
jgi:hypothetical protein